MTEIFSILKPNNPLPVVFDSPHSGTHYPEDFRHACEMIDLAQAEDKYVDELIDFAPDFGIALLKANFPRSYIDVNRAVDDIDLNLIENEWPYGEIVPSLRSDAGIGLIRRLVRPGLPLYNRYLAPSEIVHRIEHYYKPYHDALETLLDDAHYNFGQVWHINCHSMPSSSAVPKQPISLMGGKVRPSDFVLGDRDGSSCDIDFTHALRAFIEKLGYTVTLNDPFKGVELVDRYSQPTRGRHSLQIEINKALYMNEENHEKTENFEPLKTDLQKITLFITDYVSAQLTDLAAD